RRPEASGPPARPDAPELRRVSGPPPAPVLLRTGGGRASARLFHGSGGGGNRSGRSFGAAGAYPLAARWSAVAASVAPHVLQSPRAPAPHPASRITRRLDRLHHPAGTRRDATVSGRGRGGWGVGPGRRSGA